VNDAPMACRRPARPRVPRPGLSWRARSGLTGLLLAATALSLGVAPAQAQGTPRTVFRGAPPASWIAPPGVPGDSFIVFHARRTFTLAERPARFVVHVSADNRYRLFVNGTAVASGPQRSDVNHWRYETIDIAPQLRDGRNVIAAVIWNWGAGRPLAQHSARTGFLLQGDTPSAATLVNTGPGWRLRIDSAYAPIPVVGPDAGGYYAAAPGEAVDGARVPWGWERPEYRDDEWTQVVAGDRHTIVAGVYPRAKPGFGDYGSIALWQLMPRDIPPMEETPQRLAQVRRVVGVDSSDAFLRGTGDLLIPAHTTASILVDQGRTTNAYPVLDVSGGTGGTIGFTYAEALLDGRGQKGHRDSVRGRTIVGVRDRFLPAGSPTERRRFQPLWWRSFRYIQLDIRTGDTPLRIHDLHTVFTGYPFQQRGRFASDAPWIDSVWTISWNGARLGAFETYMDTPYYEQLQYVGDTRLQALLSLYVGGDDRLMRQALMHFDDSRLAEGITQSRYPSAEAQVIPPFSLIHVAMVHDFFMHRDDPALVRRLLPGVRTVLDWYGRQVDSTGMLGPMPYWNFLDWAPEWDRGVAPGADDGHSTAISLLYAYALQRAAIMEDALGTVGAGTAYRARADAIMRATRRHTWDPERGAFRDKVERPAGTPVTFSQQTNVLAVLTGAVDGATKRAVMQRALTDTTFTQATYYFAWYLHEAARASGDADRYLELLRPWRRMLALGLTSAPEKAEPTRSDTHAWSAHPPYGLLATVLGVRPGSPGFRSVEIAPHLGPLRRADGRVPHPVGDIDVRLERRGARGIRAEVTLPAGISGRFLWDGHSVVLRPGRQVFVR
jgi:alpha-L-rhamnosidase